jgi:hypothetical protein
MDELFTEEERADIEAAAQEHHQQAAELVRRAVLDALAA